MYKRENINGVLEKLRSNMRELLPYEGGAQISLEKLSAYVKLNQNESPYPPAPNVCAALKDFIETGYLNRYPPGDHAEIAKAVANYNNIKPEQIAFGNGSDEALEVISTLFLDGGKRVCFPYPDYTMFPIYCHSQNAEYEEVDINSDFILPIEEISKKKADVTFISNPHTPSGRFTPIDGIEKLGEMLFPNILVVDEAYVEFAPQNCVGLLSDNPNLIITRTFSKAFGLPSLRIGYAMAHEALVERMNAKRLPYNLGWFAYIAVLEALKDEAIEYTKGKIEEVKKWRKYLTDELENMCFYVYPSEANFILATPPSLITARELKEYLREKNILIRYFGDRRMLENSIRFTVGGEEENKKLVDVIRAVLT